MSGPRPTPTAVLAQRGSWRAKERDGEPMPPLPSDCLPPESVTGRALEIWEALAPTLYGCGLLTSADVRTFERYCRTFAAWETAMAAVERDASREAVLSLAKLDDSVRRLEAEFGLTPAARSSIRVGPTEAPQGKQRFFSKAG